jgi:cyclophilin family peptidyl-prolyl cis-trans isomerase
MPFTVANFVKLAREKFYDGLTFHSIVEDYFVQGGDPKGDGTGGPGYSIKLEVNLFLCHKPGSISMARGEDLNSAGSQFYITLPTIAKDAANYLDGRSAVFGWVKSGMETVEKIQKNDKMKSVTVAPYAGKEDCPILLDGAKKK